MTPDSNEWTGSDTAGRPSSTDGEVDHGTRAELLRTDVEKLVEAAQSRAAD